MLVGEVDVRISGDTGLRGAAAALTPTALHGMGWLLMYTGLSLSSKDGPYQESGKYGC